LQDVDILFGEEKLCKERDGSRELFRWSTIFAVKVSGSELADGFNETDVIGAYIVLSENDKIVVCDTFSKLTDAFLHDFSSEGIKTNNCISGPRHENGQSFPLHHIDSIDAIRCNSVMFLIIEIHKILIDEIFDAKFPVVLTVGKIDIYFVFLEEFLLFLAPLLTVEHSKGLLVQWCFVDGVENPFLGVRQKVTDQGNAHTSQAFVF
jgi:hypothetical protein